MKYITLIDVRLKHDFYENKVCTDFDIEATAETFSLLANHRCRLKIAPDGLRIAAWVKEQNTLMIPMLPELTLRFHLRLRNPDFALFTDLTAISGLTAPFFTNANEVATSPVPLQLREREQLVTESFVVRQPQAADRYQLHGQPLSTVQAANFIVAGQPAITGVNFYDPNSRIFTVDSSSAAKDATFTLTYLTAPQLPRGVFAELDIVNNASLPSTGAQFEVRFAAKRAKWRYYIVTDKPTGDLHIVDIALAGNGVTPLLFSEANRIQLSATTEFPANEPPDRIAQALATQYPSPPHQRWRFTSDNEVESKNRARKTLRLQIGTGDGAPRVMAPLPNPSLHNIALAAPEVEETEGEETEDEEAQRKNLIYQIVKYLSDQVLT